MPGVRYLTPWIPPPGSLHLAFSAKIKDKKILGGKKMIKYVQWLKIWKYVRAPRFMGDNEEEDQVNIFFFDLISLQNLT